MFPKDTQGHIDPELLIPILQKTENFFIIAHPPHFQQMVHRFRPVAKTPHIIMVPDGGVFFLKHETRKLLKYIIYVLGVKHACQR